MFYFLCWTIFGVFYVTEIFSNLFYLRLWKSNSLKSFLIFFNLSSRKLFLLSTDSDLLRALYNLSLDMLLQPLMLLLFVTNFSSFSDKFSIVILVGNNFFIYNCGFDDCYLYGWSLDGCSLTIKRRGFLGGSIWNGGGQKCLPYLSPKL